MNELRIHHMVIIAIIPLCCHVFYETLARKSLQSDSDIRPYIRTIVVD